MKTVSRMVLGVVVVGSIGGLVVAARAQRGVEGRLGTVKGEGLHAVLQESIPPVTIHHVVFGRPVQVSAAEAQDEAGTPATARVLLKYASAGVVIGKDYRAFRVDVGGRVSVGDFIVGGVIENAGTSPVLVFFSGGGGQELQVGERLYIGSRERLLRDSDESVGSVAATTGGPGTHCGVCSCTCSCTGAGSCGFTFDTNANGGDQCGASNGSGCVCSGDNGCSGTTGGCSRTFVPCIPAE